MPLIPPSAPGPSLRLHRDPSLAAELRQSVVFASVPCFIAAVGWWGWTTGSDTAPPPDWVRFALPVFALVTLGFLWNVVLKARRAISGRAPVVEVDAQPWRPGDPAQVRIADPDAGSLDGLDVFLVAEDIRVERVPLTTANSSGWRFSEVVRHHLAILSLARVELRALGPVDRVVSIVVPPEAAGNEWRWQILLVGRVARGVPREDRYPVAIHEMGKPSRPGLPGGG